MQGFCRKIMHPFFLALCAMWVSFLGTGKVHATLQNIIVYLNGNPVQFTDAKPTLLNDRTMVPVRTISESLGYTVTWDGVNQKVDVEDKNNKIELQINSNLTHVNGKEVTLDASAMILSDRTYVPLRFIAENFGCQVDWKIDGDILKVYILKPDAQNQSGGAVPPSQNNPSPTQPSQPQQPTGQVYPDGWVAPVLKSSWSPDEKKNFEVFKNELGFGDDGQTFSFPGQKNAIVLYDSGSGNGYEVMFRFA